MIPSTFAVVLASASTVLAFESISIQRSVKADTEVVVTLRNDIADGSDSFDAGFTNFNVYLSTTPPGWGSGPVCLLANGTKIDATSVKVKIPADAVPDDADLQIVTKEWNADPYKDGPSGFQYSNSFTFDGGKAEWGKSELGGRTVGDSDSIPCTAYACARKCADKYFDQFDESEDEDVLEEVYKAEYECIAACPGVKYPSWDSVTAQDEEYEDGEGYDDEDESAESTSSAAAESSATATSHPSTTITTQTPSSTATEASSTVGSSATEGTQSASSPSGTSNAMSKVSAGSKGISLVALIAGLALL